MRLNTLFFAFPLLIICSAGQALGSEDGNAPSAPPPPATPDSAIEAPKTSSSSASEISLADWNRDDWMLLKPRMSLLELDGYFRMRATAFRKLDFDNGSEWDLPSHSYPAQSDGKADYTGTNIRLRFEPRINVTSNLRVITTIDVFDNLVLGSTPNSYSGHSDVPVEILSTSQSAPDQIEIKRAYAVATALNEQLELRFGRMPDHWGLGMLRNSGDCLDCNYGDVVDRVSATLKIADHLISPIYTWRSSGPTFKPHGMEAAQGLDAYTWDDIEDFSIRVIRADHPEDIAERVAHGETVFNYGVLNEVRQNPQGLKRSYYYNDNIPTTIEEQTNTFLTSTTAPSERREGFLYIGDAYVRMYTGNLELSFEAAALYGSFLDTAISAQSDEPTTELSVQETSIYQLGGALELTYKFDGDYANTRFSLKAGGASGDSAAGYGALNAGDSQRTAASTGTSTDASLNNFQFNPDYHVDLLMYRQLIGTVTDSWYLKPEVAYQFDDNLTGSLAGIYSQAIFKRSTAGCFSEDGNICEDTDKQGSLPMGLEFDAALSYSTARTPGGGSFGGTLAGGILFPMAGFNDLTVEEGTDGSGSFAWTIQTNLHITF